MTPRPLPIVAVVLCGLAVAACSDDDGNAANTTAGGATSSTEAQWTQTGTGNPTASTTASTTTGPPTTTPPPTTATPTTALETTTTANEEAATKRAIERAIVEERVAYVNAVMHPRSRAAERRLRNAYSAAIVEEAIANLITVRENGWIARPHPTIPDAAQVEGEVELLGAKRAQATQCTVSSAILVEPGAGPNGEDVIVNDQVVARRSTTTVVFERGRWRISTRDRQGEWLGEESCPDA
jgi:hypothetical protein